MMIASRAFALSVVATTIFSAPWQCSSKRSPDVRMEEDAGEALYTLAQHFADKKDEQARVETLRYLIAKYPKSRFSEMARLDLGEAAAPKK